MENVRIFTLYKSDGPKLTTNEVKSGIHFIAIFSLLLFGLIVKILQVLVQKYLQSLQQALANKVR